MMMVTIIYPSSHVIPSQGGHWTLDTAMIYGWRGNSLQLDA